MHVFYTPDINSDEYVLNEEESNHCLKVLRLGVGAKVSLIDGIGGLYTAEIISQTKKNVNLRIVASIEDYNKRNHHLHIAVAPTKNIDRIEWFLEKATEIGVDEITPVICERSERRVIKEDRLFKVITSAVKQSLQAYHPKLNPITDFGTFLTIPNDSHKFIAHCVDSQSRQQISDTLSHNLRYTVLIGPEGDFTSKEISLARTVEIDVM